MRSSPPIRGVRFYTTFGGETDFFSSVLIPTCVIIAGVVLAIIQFLPTDIAFHEANILRISAVGVVAGIVILAYLIGTAGKYTDQAVFHSYWGVVLSLVLYLLISVVAVVVSFGIAEFVTAQTLLTSLDWPTVLHGLAEGHIVMLGAVIATLSSIVLAAENRRRLAQQYHGVAEVKHLFEEETEQSLAHIENEISGVGHIERTETNRLREAVRQTDHAMLLGDGGVGKSGILKTIADDCEKPVLFLDLTRYPGIQTKSDLAEKIGVNGDIDHAITQVGLDAGLVVFIDQLDDIGGTEVQVVTDFVFDTIELDGISVIFACREHDLETHPEYASLRNPSEFTVRSTVQRLNPAIAKRQVEALTGTEPSEDLVEVGRNLQYLDVIAELTDDGVDLTNISGKAAVWEKYRKSLEEEYQPGDDDRRGGRVLQRAVDYAVKATEDDSNIFSVPPDQDWADNQLLNRGVIIASSTERGNRRHRFRHPDFQTYLYAWDAVQDGEGLKAVTDRLDDRLGKDVFRWMLLLYIQSDTALKDQFPDLSQAPMTGDATRSFLEELLDADDGLGYYATTAILDEIKTWNARTNPELADTVLAKLEGREELYRYFFGPDTDPSWAYTLLDRGSFDDPGPVAIGFLGDIAPEHPETVSELVAAVETQDMALQGLLISVIRELPVDDAASHTDLVVDLFAESQLERDRVSFRTVQLLGDLIKKGRPDAGLDLLAVVTEPHRPDDGRKPVAKVELHTLSNLLEDTLETLIDEHPVRCINVLEANLRDTVRMEADLREWEVDTVVGYSQSPIGSSDFDRPGHHHLRGLLTGSLREASEIWLDGASADMRRETIEAYLTSIALFRRLGFHFLNRYADSCPDLVRRELQDQTNYREYRTQQDFLKLLRDRFADLSASDREQVVQVICSVPVEDDLEKLAEQRSEQYEDYTAEEIFEQRQDHWLRERLWLIRSDLPQVGEQVLTGLLDKYDDEPGDLLSSGRARMGAISQEAPRPTDELRTMAPGELLRFCIEWEPDTDQGWEEADDGGFREVSRRGLAEAAVEVMLEDPSRYEEQIPRLRQANSVYAAELLNQVRKTLDDDPESLRDGFPWGPVFELCDVIAANPSDWDDSARIAAARLLKAGVTTDAYRYLLEYGELKALLVAFLDDPDPSPERDRPPEGYAGHNNPFQVALNAVRPLALDGLIIYAVRTATQRKFDGYAEEGESGINQDIREQLISMLDDTSLAVGAVYGHRLQKIWWLDHDFVHEHLETLFPRQQNTESRNRFSAAWDAYVSFNTFHVNLYPVLRPYYFHSIDLVAEDATTDINQAPEGLAYNILLAYIHGYEELDDRNSLVTYLYDRDAPDFARQMAWGLWRSGKDNDEVRQKWDRVEALWKMRLEQIDDVEAHISEIQWFVEWLTLIQEQVAFEDIFKLIGRSLPFIAKQRRMWETLESYLATQASDHPETVITLYRELMDQGASPYPVRFSEETATVLKPALDEPDVRGYALDIAEQFAKHGDDDARAFLENNT